MQKPDLKQLEQDALEAMPYLASDEKSASLKDAEKNEFLKNSNQAVKPWVHFVAGGVGGMMGAVFTCPFDVVKTRLQSDVYQSLYRSQINTKRSIVSQGLQHFGETFGIIGNVYRSEGFRSLFKGLGPNLVGVIPARSINFFTYGTCKELYANNFNHGQQAPWVHLMAAATAGIATSTATNPIWLVKTRLQLDRAGTKQYANSYDCLVKIIKSEGIKGLYKGMSASYLGSVEGILQWVLYEQMKHAILQKSLARMETGQERSSWDTVVEWCARSGAAGAAKFVASIVTYPHEVVRTRLRQAPMENGKPKYTGLVQSFRLIMKEEGLASMYGGLTPHLLRTVPNSIIMFGTWELVIKLLN